MFLACDVTLGWDRDTKITKFKVFLAETKRTAQVWQNVMWTTISGCCAWFMASWSESGMLWNRPNTPSIGASLLKQWSDSMQLHAIKEPAQILSTHLEHIENECSVESKNSVWLSSPVFFEDWTYSRSMWKMRGWWESLCVQNSSPVRQTLLVSIYSPWLVFFGTESCFWEVCWDRENWCSIVLLCERKNVVTAHCFSHPHSFTKFGGTVQDKNFWCGLCLWNILQSLQLENSPVWKEKRWIVGGNNILSKGKRKGSWWGNRSVEGTPCCLLVSLQTLLNWYFNSSPNELVMSGFFVFQTLNLQQRKLEKNDTMVPGFGLFSRIHEHVHATQQLRLGWFMRNADVVSKLPSLSE